MAHTEKEANEMQCCGPSDCGAAYESNLDGVYFRFCTASRCMAWRWEKTIQYPSFPAGAGGAMMEATNFSNDDLMPKTHNTERGYCGLAGKP